MHLAISNGIGAAIICNSGFSDQSKILKKKNIPVFGGDIMQDTLELDQEAFIRFCKRYNIRVSKDTIKKLYPLTTEIWFSNGNPLYQYINYIKQYKFLAGDLGVDSEESVVLWGNPDRNVESVKRIFENGLFDVLKLIKYTGVFSLDAYISEDDNYPYVFRIVPRLQAPVLACMLELYSDNFGNLIMNLLQNSQPSLLLQNKISISVAVSQPPYPFDKSALVKYITASDNNWIEVRKKLGKELRQLDLPNLQYRIDAGLQASYLEDMKRTNYYH